MITIGRLKEIRDELRGYIEENHTINDDAPRMHQASFEYSELLEIVELLLEANDA